MAFYLINGLISGMLLASFFALCDALFGTVTFPVLIDVNYIPALQGLPPVVELLIHLVISILVTVLFYVLYPEYGLRTPKYLLAWITILTLLYVPFSLLSNQRITLATFFVWLLGHAIYIVFLAFQAERNR